MATITMNDIAEKAGVSRTAVSKILNHRGGGLSAKTREKVFKVANELNYRPNYFATSLKSGTTHCIGLMGSLTIADFNFPYYSTITGSIENTMVAQKYSHSLLVFGANINEARYEKSVELIKKGLVDGLILIVLAKDLPKFEAGLLPVLRDIRIPFVVIHSLSRNLAYNNVGLDSFEVGHLAARHLSSLGYRDIGCYMEGEGLILHDQEMMDGFAKALTEAGLAWDPAKQIIRPRAADAQNSYSLAYRTFRQLEKIPRAIFTSNEDAGYGIRDALRDRGLRLPADVALVSESYEKTPSTHQTDLTVIYNPAREKGAEAVKMLMSIINGERDRHTVYQTILKPSLIVRQTCGAGR